jgi:hypothetical protein
MYGKTSRLLWCLVWIRHSEIIDRPVSKLGSSTQVFKSKSREEFVEFCAPAPNCASGVSQDSSNSLCKDSPQATIGLGRSPKATPTIMIPSPGQAHSGQVSDFEPLREL